jgi:hypothetical protein
MISRTFVNPHPFLNRYAVHPCVSHPYVSHPDDEVRPPSLNRYAFHPHHQHVLVPFHNAQVNGQHLVSHGIRRKKDKAVRSTFQKTSDSVPFPHYAFLLDLLQAYAEASY